MKLTEIAFFTEDVAQMTDFYHRLLGTRPVSHSEQMAIFLLGELKIFIHYRYSPKDGELPPENHFAFLSEDVDEDCSQLVAQGMTIEIHPRDYYWGRSAYLRDPDGRQIEITQKHD